MSVIGPPMIDSGYYYDWNLNSDILEFQYEVLNSSNILLIVHNRTLNLTCNLRFKKDSQFQFKKSFPQTQYSSHRVVNNFYNKLMTLLKNKNIIENEYIDVKSETTVFTLNPRVLLNLL